MSENIESVELADLNEALEVFNQGEAEYVSGNIATARELYEQGLATFGRRKLTAPNFVINTVLPTFFPERKNFHCY